MNQINKFKGWYDFLSNFYEQEFEFEGKLFKTVEHAFQAQKTIDDVDFERVKNAPTPGLAKKLGRMITIRRDWESIRLDMMYQLVSAKFQNDDLSRKLKATFPYDLVEGNTWNDTFWGVYNGVGENHLGKILMRVRSEITKGNQ